MAIYKAKVPSHFAIIPNETAQDSQLSFEARGVLTLMLSMPDDWAIHKEWLIKQSPKCGRDKMTRILKELIDCGYVVKKAVHEGGRLNGVDWLVYAEPNTEQLKTRRTENQSDCKSNTTNKQSNKEKDKQRNNTDISKADERVFLEDIKFDYDLRFCQEAIDQLRHLNKLNYCRAAYDGSLTLREWQDCEDAMRSIDDFDFEYFTWWMETRSQSMHKAPSLPNMLCDMNGIEFEQFYDSTFLQEWD